MRFGEYARTRRFGSKLDSLYLLSITSLRFPSWLFSFASFAVRLRNPGQQPEIAKSRVSRQRAKLAKERTKNLMILLSRAAISEY